MAVDGESLPQPSIIRDLKQQLQEPRKLARRLRAGLSAYRETTPGNVTPPAPFTGGCERKRKNEARNSTRPPQPPNVQRNLQAKKLETRKSANRGYKRKPEADEGPESKRQQHNSLLRNNSRSNDYGKQHCSTTLSIGTSKRIGRISNSEFTDGDAQPTVTPGISHSRDPESIVIVEVNGDSEGCGYNHSNVETRKGRFKPLMKFLPNWLKQNERCTLPFLLFLPGPCLSPTYPITVHKQLLLVWCG